MCEIKVFLLEDGEERLILESVEYLKVEEKKVFIRNIFGEKIEVEAYFKEFDNTEGKILLHKT